MWDLATSILCGDTELPLCNNGHGIHLCRSLIDDKSVILDLCGEIQVLKAEVLELRTAIEEM